MQPICLIDLIDFVFHSAEVFSIFVRAVRTTLILIMINLDFLAKFESEKTRFFGVYLLHVITIFTIKHNTCVLVKLRTKYRCHNRSQ